MCLRISLTSTADTFPSPLISLTVGSAGFGDAVCAAVGLAVGTVVAFVGTAVTDGATVGIPEVGSSDGMTGVTVGSGISAVGIAVGSIVTDGSTVGTGIPEVGSSDGITGVTVGSGIIAVGKVVGSIVTDGSTVGTGM